jgi:deoxyadenosine/deoxycytidine kinase
MAATGVVTVEGLIGAGKSSVKEALEVACAADGLDVVFVDEPVDTWAEFVDGDGVGILELFYQNQSRWAFSFQMMAYISRLERLATARRENPGKLIVAERSLAADHRTFAKMLHDSGDIGDIEFKIYQKWFSTFAAKFEPDVVIHLQTPVALALERITRRSRGGEETVDANYLRKLDRYTTEWLENAGSTTVVPLSPTDDAGREIPARDLAGSMLPTVRDAIESYTSACRSARLEWPCWHVEVGL